MLLWFAIIQVDELEDTLYLKSKSVAPLPHSPQTPLFYPNPTDRQQRGLP